MATDVQIALQPQAGQDPAAALTAAAVKLVRASLELLIQQAGQAMTGKIMAPPPGLPPGLSQISVADQVLTLKLSAPLPAGTPVRIDVQQTAGGQPAVTVQRVLTPQPAPAPTVPPPPSPLPLPAAAAQPPQVQAPQPTPPQTAPTPPATAPTPTPAPVTPQLPVTSAASRPVPSAPIAPAPWPPVAAPSTQVPTPVASPSASSMPVALTQASPNPATTLPPVAAAPTPAAAPPAAPPAATAAPGLPQSTPQAPPAPPSPPLLPAQTTAAALQPGAPAPIATPSMAVASVPGAPASAPPPLSPPPTTISTTPQVPAPSAAPPQVLMQRLAQAFAPPPSASAPQPAPVPGSPAQALLAATTQAAAQQQSPAPLLQALAVALPQLPKPVAEAAARVLAGRINLDRGAPTGDALKQAVLKSGIFVDTPAKTGSPPDLRQALTQLRGTLLAWLGDDIAPVAAVARRPPPPARGAVPRGQAPELPPQLEGGTREAGRSLLGQTEGALSRIKLMQLSAQPAEARPGGAMAAPGEWTLELPLILGRELAMAQIQIGRDDSGKAELKDKRWRLRFALKFSVLGEVGAQVSMVGARTSIAIWADEEATAETLEAMLPELAPSLAAKGLELVSLTVRRGVPRDETQPAGRLMDSTR